MNRIIYMFLDEIQEILDDDKKYGLKKHITLTASPTNSSSETKFKFYTDSTIKFNNSDKPNVIFQYDTYDELDDEFIEAFVSFNKTYGKTFSCECEINIANYIDEKICSISFSLTSFTLNSENKSIMFEFDDFSFVNHS